MNFCVRRGFLMARRIRFFRTRWRLGDVMGIHQSVCLTISMAPSSGSKPI